MRRVVITGMGCVTPAGIGLGAFEDALWKGESCFVSLHEKEQEGLKFTQLGRVENFSPKLQPEQVQLTERSSQFAIMSAREALLQADVMKDVPGHRVAAVFGCSAGGRSMEEPELAKLYSSGGRVHPLTVPRAMASAGVSLVSMEHGITGPAYTLNTACASSTHAIGQAFHMIRNGMVDAAITGGHEAPLTYGFLRAWDSLRVVSPTACKPFAKDRDGLTLSEGAGMFVLEEMESAARRGAPLLGELVGFGMSSDATHMTHPHANGPAAAMQSALRDCGELTAPICYINAHGTGTLVNDAVEAQAIHIAFGDACDIIPISSTKSMHGHAMGAAGAMEAIATVLALHRKMAPATANCAEVDSALQLNVITGAPFPLCEGIALSNSFAFGGINATLAFRSL